ncbi:hypothetical protein E2C01_053120 [Portunus trituberculatus]|uniref:Uncharacterized protein n=1 Tax=Portunus trituberculatus TaxID=210409 RepID=A0A5B7GNM8_PORTR|nr:hypothetical protein [Portunus trituberculatus]
MATPSWRVAGQEASDAGDSIRPYLVPSSHRNTGACLSFLLLPCLILVAVMRTGGSVREWEVKRGRAREVATNRLPVGIRVALSKHQQHQCSKVWMQHHATL